MNTPTIPKRSEIAIEHTWNAESVFASAAEWEAQLARVMEQLRGISSFHGRLGDSAAALADWFAALDELNAGADKLYVYGTMLRAADISGPATSNSGWPRQSD